MEEIDQKLLDKLRNIMSAKPDEDQAAEFLSKSLSEKPILV